MLLVTNLRTGATIPWSVPIMGLVLWAMWRYLDGRYPPRRTSEERHRLLRARFLSPSVFAWALVSGILALIALAGFWIVLVQLVKFPPHVLPHFSRYPFVTVTLVIIMACLVSSLPEEAAFRGYFQTFLERRLPGAVAIVISALVLAPGHCLTQGFLWPVVLFYFAVDSMLGTLAYLTKSILPGIAVHFIGLLIFFTLIWPRDGSRPLVRDAGAGTWFWIHVAQTIICGWLAVAAFRWLARQVRTGDDIPFPIRTGQVRRD